MEQWTLRDGKEGSTTIGGIQKMLHSWWKERVAYLLRKVDDYVKHIFREHNQEEDRFAMLGGGRKIEGRQGHGDVESSWWS